MKPLNKRFGLEIGGNQLWHFSRYKKSAWLSRLKHKQKRTVLFCRKFYRISNLNSLKIIHRIFYTAKSVWFIESFFKRKYGKATASMHVSRVWYNYNWCFFRLGLSCCHWGQRKDFNSNHEAEVSVESSSFWNIRKVESCSCGIQMVAKKYWACRLTWAMLLLCNSKPTTRLLDREMRMVFWKFGICERVDFSGTSTVIVSKSIRLVFIQITRPQSAPLAQPKDVRSYGILDARGSILRLVSKAVHQ